jgi:hypothetical protein
MRLPGVRARAPCLDRPSDACYGYIGAVTDGATDATVPAGDGWPPAFWSGARITHRKLTFWSRYSRMRVDETGRVTLTSRKGVDLDVHMTELKNLHQPLWMLMCGLYFEAAGKKWYVTFSEVREIDWAALHAFTPQLGLVLADIQDLANQAMLSMVWMMLLDPTPPAATPATPAVDPPA